ncbi:DUF485 domain-containing protein [Wenjunlia vitaminophila]|uniref:DUF485 domain-containing protein n=1 Tax=Wenjunlia vitaminophila TaxID=76728 RepID=UPI00039A9A71|nr:DUF485 domain-containing protein [Wenjunlia vitaminophila]
MDTAHRPVPPDDPYSQVQAGPEFGELRRSYRRFAFPLTVAFISWYLLYVLLSNYAGDFMASTVVGNINTAFVFGLLQFLTTFLIAWWYARHANARLDPRADLIRASLEASLANLDTDTGGGTFDAGTTTSTTKAAPESDAR